MLSIYPACFFKEENGYSVIFPDLDDLATCGENLEEAMTMAVDCLAGHLYTLKQEGKKAPTPSAVSSVWPPQAASPSVRTAAMAREISFFPVFLIYALPPVGFIRRRSFP